MNEKRPYNRLVSWYNSLKRAFNEMFPRRKPVRYIPRYNPDRWANVPLTDGGRLTDCCGLTDGDGLTDGNGLSDGNGLTDFPLSPGMGLTDGPGLTDCEGLTECGPGEGLC